MREKVLLATVMAALSVGCGSSGGGGVSMAPADGGAASGGAPTKGAPLCAPCQVKADCAGDRNQCLVNNATGEHHCGQDCTDAACPAGYQCVTLTGNGAGARQCAPVSGSCTAAAAPATPTPAPATPAPATPAPAPGTCDPKFTGPFCMDGPGGAQVLIGFDPGPPVPNPTIAEVRRFSLAAVNHIRARTCLPPLSADTCLDDIGTRANAAVATLGVHGYFLQNCLNAAHGFGKSCECGWTQENYGAASGSSRTWKDGVLVPLCGMMTEPKGQGHRGNIESPAWKRMGVGITTDAHGASWCHEFGN